MKTHSPPLQGAPVTGDAARNVGSSFWRRHFPVSFPGTQSRGHGALHLGWDLGSMRTLAGVPLPFVIISEGKLEFIRNSFIHLVLHHWQAVGFRATPISGRAQRQDKLILFFLVGGTTLIPINSWNGSNTSSSTSNHPYNYFPFKHKNLRKYYTSIFLCLIPTAASEIWCS